MRNRDGRNAFRIGGERKGGATFSRGVSERFAQEGEANALPPRKLKEAQRDADIHHRVGGAWRRGVKRVKACLKLRRSGAEA